MRSKQIALKYLTSKISNPTMIFEDTNLFRLILPWAKDSARELFSSNPQKIFLISRLDSIAPIVNDYMLSRAQKMLKNARKKKNSLYFCLNNLQKTISWIIDRWINTFTNLTLNPDYRDYIDIKSTEQSIAKLFNINYYDCQSQLILNEFTQKQKLIQKLIKKIYPKFDLKKVDMTEFFMLCVEQNITLDNLIEVLNKEYTCK
ncbi:MAG TPA: hypothetical protein EYP33_03180 [Pyrodictium sp.]|nr:hypothetical protein [Pyrodictium sp.]